MTEQELSDLEAFKSLSDDDLLELTDDDIMYLKGLEEKQAQENRESRGMEEHERMMNNINAKRAAITANEKANELANNGVLANVKRFGENALRMASPYSSEMWEHKTAKGEEPTYGDIAGGIGKDLLVGATQAAMPFAKGLPSLLALGGTNVGVDLMSQAQNEDISAPRTGINLLLNAVPMVSRSGPFAKDVAEASVFNTFLPGSKKMESPNAPDFRFGLEEGLFRGSGKYSALDDIERKLAPIWESLDAAKAGAGDVDLDLARKNAIELVNADSKLGAEERDLIVGKINKWFDSEISQPGIKKTIPAETYFQSDLDPVAYETERRAQKSKYTRARNKWMKTGEPDELPPHEETPSVFDPRFWSENEIVASPERTFYGMPIKTAIQRKSGAQNSAYNLASQTEKGASRAQKEISRGMNQAIETVSPEARRALKESAPYMSLKDVISHRQNIGGSNPIMSLKDWAAALLATQHLPAYAVLPAMAAYRYARSPQGAQSLYDLGKTIERTSQPLGLGSIATQRVTAPFLLEE